MKVCSKHPNRKVHSREMCASCYNKWLKENNPEFGRKQKENCSKWAKLNKDKKAEYDLKRREHYRLNEKDNPVYKLKRRNQQILKKYGIDHFDYLKQLELQNNRCAICHKSNTPGKYLHIDHCHETGRFRGLLCHQCNWYIGLVDADKEIKIRLAMYGTSINEVHPDIRSKQLTKLDKSIK
jgi:hypothetical protein